MTDLTELKNYKMETIRETDNFILEGGMIGRAYPVFRIITKAKQSSLFTREVADSLSSMDSECFDNECSELMKVENFHIEREFTNAD